MIRARLLVLAAGALAGCQVIGGFEEFTPRAGGDGGSGASAGSSAGGTSSAGSAGAAGAGGSACGGKAPPMGVKGAPLIAHGLPDGTCWFVDAREVSRAEYEMFAATSDPGKQSTLCNSVNPILAQDAECMKSVPAGDDLPVVCVDACDALSFCAWAGKVLCPGTFGTPTGATDVWHNACSANGTTTHGYPGAENKDVCNGAGKAVGKLLPVGKQPACKTAEGVFDMSGNAAEWTDACDTQSGATDKCQVRGGSFADVAISCQANEQYQRTKALPSVGFRCCSPPG